MLASCCSIDIWITKIINVSLSSGVFPSHFKHDNVNTFLKKLSLPDNDLNNYRPISNLSFISKVLEEKRVVSSRECSLKLKSPV